MKKITYKKYRVNGQIKVLEGLSCFVEDENKEYEVHYRIDIDGNRLKTASSKKIDDKLIEQIEYSLTGEVKRKLNYYYYESGQLKRCETIYKGKVQQYVDYILDDRGNIIAKETDDSISFFQKITFCQSDEYSVVGYHYDKFAEIIEEGVEVQIFKGELISRLLSYDDSRNTFNHIDEVRGHYKNFEHIKICQINYSDYSGAFLDILKTNFHYETHYEYHKNGKLKSEIQFECNNFINKISIKKIKEDIYDENGFCLSNKFNVGTRYESVFNEKGDWIERRKYQHDHLINITVKKEETIENIA